jgi:DNA polymerase I-like protein with 3'-5' exonuclease and polymerase domains/uracil-DNA glycosylase
MSEPFTPLVTNWLHERQVPHLTFATLIPSPILVVGEAPGSEEHRVGRPFVGQSGTELMRMLEEAGINPSHAAFTNVVQYRPVNNDISYAITTKRSAIKAGFKPLWGRYISPDPRVTESLEALAFLVQDLDPSVVVALGDTALWALTGESGITKFRGSCLWTRAMDGTDRRWKVIPTYHPAAVLRMWAFRTPAVQDLRRAEEESHRADYAPPSTLVTTRPGAPITSLLLNKLLRLLDYTEEGMLCIQIAADIETRGGYMACVGLAYRDPVTGVLIAISIPYMCVEEQTGYFSAPAEVFIRNRVRRVLTHPKARIVWQNGMYDAQYFIREERYMPRIDYDTMLAQHAMLPGTPKDLNYLSSIYCEYHRYWKDEGKTWSWKMGEDSLWQYNAQDCISTLLIHEAQQSALHNSKPYYFLLALCKPVQAMMTKGVRLDWPGIKQDSKWAELEMEVALARLQRRWGSPINPSSSVQLKKVFYNTLGLPSVKNRKTGKPTLDENALRALARSHPWTRLLSDLILEYRQNVTYRSTFLEQRPSPDNRFHTSFNIGGPETYRFSSSANAFYEGCNGQNLPPRFRRFVLPDPGYELEDWDLDRADAQVVAWDAGDDDLKEVFRRGDNIHIINCKKIFPQTATWSDEAIQATAKHPESAQKFYTLTKNAVHGINYGVYKNTLAKTIGVTAHEAQRLIDRWFAEHPAIAAWHERVEEDLQLRRCVTNAFGFRRVYFDRMSPSLVQEALAWIGQSTVAIVISKALLNIYHELPEVDLLLQVHDSLLLQVPIDRREELRPLIQDQMLIEIPYPDPLTIPVGGKASENNWYDCKEFTIT